MMGTMMQDLAFAIPGVDEAMSFAEIMKYVRTTLCASAAGGLVLTGALQARQVHGILCNRLRHGPNWAYPPLSFLSERAGKGPGQVVNAERADRTHDQSGMDPILFVPGGDAFTFST